MNEITAFVCGPPERCTDGNEHDEKGRETLYNADGKPCGESVACSRCGLTAFERDLWRAE